VGDGGDDGETDRTTRLLAGVDQADADERCDLQRHEDHAAAEGYQAGGDAGPGGATEKASGTYAKPTCNGEYPWRPSGRRHRGAPNMRC